MITRENLREVVDSLDDKTKQRILSSEKYYVVLTLHIFNVGLMRLQGLPMIMVGTSMLGNMVIVYCVLRTCKVY